MDMPARKFGNETRYGFNGKERDKDMNSLTAYDYGFRIYNPAIGRFLSLDPLTKDYPWYTPYQFSGNSPILSTDIDGLEPTEKVNENEKLFEGSSFTIKEFLEKSKHVPNWFQRTQANEKTPKLALTETNLIRITATVMGELAFTWGGFSRDQQIAVGWVYYNNMAAIGGKETKGAWGGLNASFAFNTSSPGTRAKVIKPTSTVAGVMQGLGDNTYVGSADKSIIDDAKLLMADLKKAFLDPFSNPYPGFTGQGYTGDFNLNDQSKQGNHIWIMARAYYWLQLEGKVPNDFNNTLVVKLQTSSTKNPEYTTFIYNSAALVKYFKYSYNWKTKTATNLPSNVPKYDTSTGNKEESP